MKKILMIMLCLITINANSQTRIGEKMVVSQSDCQEVFDTIYNENKGLDTIKRHLDSQIECVKFFTTQMHDKKQGKLNWQKECQNYIYNMCETVRVKIKTTDVLKNKYDTSSNKIQNLTASVIGYGLVKGPTIIAQDIKKKKEAKNLQISTTPTSQTELTKSNCTKKNFANQTGVLSVKWNESQTGVWSSLQQWDSKRCEITCDEANKFEKSGSICVCKKSENYVLSGTKCVCSKGYTTEKDGSCKRIECKDYEILNLKTNQCEPKPCDVFGQTRKDGICSCPDEYQADYANKICVLKGAPPVIPSDSPSFETTTEPVENLQLSNEPREMVDADGVVINKESCNLCGASWDDVSKKCYWLLSNTETKYFLQIVPFGTPQTICDDMPKSYMGMVIGLSAGVLTAGAIVFTGGLATLAAAPLAVGLGSVGVAGIGTSAAIASGVAITASTTTVGGIVGAGSRYGASGNKSEYSWSFRNVCKVILPSNDIITGFSNGIAGSGWINTEDNVREQMESIGHMCRINFAGNELIKFPTKIKQCQSSIGGITTLNNCSN